MGGPFLRATHDVILLEHTHLYAQQLLIESD